MPGIKPPGCGVNGIAPVSPQAADFTREPEGARRADGWNRLSGETKPVFTLLPFQRGQDIQFRRGLLLPGRLIEMGS